ncbi:MAG: hypothetical protein HGA67_01915 [Candidatus Yonathbacteria bacterium]|nr:hypothetical protein [Candidatus Yonathbacteria bacterium]
MSWERILGNSGSEIGKSIDFLSVSLENLLLTLSGSSKRVCFDSHDHWQDHKIQLDISDNALGKYTTRDGVPLSHGMTVYFITGGVELLSGKAVYMEYTVVGIGPDLYPSIIRTVPYPPDSDSDREHIALKSLWGPPYRAQMEFRSPEEFRENYLARPQ